MQRIQTQFWLIVMSVYRLLSPISSKKAQTVENLIAGWFYINKFPTATSCCKQNFHFCILKGIDNVLETDTEISEIYSWA